MVNERNIVTLENVSKTYKNGVNALNNINLNINEGELVYIVGYSGAGKSTLFKMLYLEEKPSSGDIIIDNESILNYNSKKKAELRRKIGCVFQDFKLLERKTVFENISFVLEVIGTPKKEIKNRVEDILAKMNLLDKKDTFPSDLSGGQQQRVAIARALVNNPKILIADEPTGNLDPETGESVFNELVRINKEFGTTVIMTTHNQTLVDKYKYRVIELNNGKLVRDEQEGEYKGE